MDAVRIGERDLYEQEQGREREERFFHTVEGQILQ